jgi:hypothetical protein
MSYKVMLISFLIVMGALFLSGTLFFIRYTSTINDIIAEEYKVLSSKLKDTIDSMLSIGMNLEDMGSLQQIIDQMKEGHKGIVSIKIFQVNDQKGETIFDTRLAGIKGEVPGSWVNQVSQQGMQPFWIYKGDDNINLLGTSVKNDLALFLGGIIIRYSDDLADLKIAETRHTLFSLILILLSIATFLIFILFKVVLRKFSENLKEAKNLTAASFKKEQTLLITDQPTEGFLSYFVPPINEMMQCKKALDNVKSILLIEKGKIENDE